MRYLTSWRILAVSRVIPPWRSRKIRLKTKSTGGSWSCSFSPFYVSQGRPFSGRTLDQLHEVGARCDAGQVCRKPMCGRQRLRLNKSLLRRQSRLVLPVVRPLPRSLRRFPEPHGTARRLMLSATPRQPTCPRRLSTVLVGAARLAMLLGAVAQRAPEEARSQQNGISTGTAHALRTPCRDRSPPADWSTWRLWSSLTSPTQPASTGFPPVRYPRETQHRRNSRLRISNSTTTSLREFLPDGQMSV